MNKKDKIWVRLMEYGSRFGCHQKPERSFFYQNYQFPVCARCTGVIIGEIIAVILLFFRIKIDLIFSITLLLIMGLDWFVQFVEILHSDNIRRLITGFFGGLGLTYIYFYAVTYFINIFLTYVHL